MDDGGCTQVILMAGLQGTGKTTACGKLALYLKGQGKRVSMVATDVYRPAAIDQLVGSSQFRKEHCLASSSPPHLSFDVFHCEQQGQTWLGNAFCSARDGISGTLSRKCKLI